MRGNAMFGFVCTEEKVREVKPILSDDQLENIQKLILEANINKMELEFIVYRGCNTQKIVGVVEKIYPQSMKIILTNKKAIHFCEIIKVRELLN